MKRRRSERNPTHQLFDKVGVPLNVTSATTSGNGPPATDLAQAGRNALNVGNGCSPAETARTLVFRWTHQET